MPAILDGCSENARQRVKLLQRSGIQLDQYGMVVPHLDRQELADKVCNSLAKLRPLIQNALSTGKSVIYLPGAYDLVHAGHASYFQQAVEIFMNRAGLSREQIVVVVLADSDDLIAASKPFTKYRGGAPHRPLQNGRVLGDHFHASPLPCHPRLIDLACCDVDYVAMTPSPIEASDLLRSKIFRDWLRESATFRHEGTLATAPGAQAELGAKIHATVQQYERLVRFLVKNELIQIQASFLANQQGNQQEPAQIAWTLPAWQLIIHRFLCAIPATNPKSSYFRVVSKHDSYAPEVKALMALSGQGIRCAEIEDQHVLSTTDLVERYGWLRLVSSKLEGLKRCFESR